MGRGTLQANWDPDVMADSINPCWLAEGNLCSFLGRWEQGRGWERKVGAFWQAVGCSWTRVAELQELLGAGVV